MNFIPTLKITIDNSDYIPSDGTSEELMEELLQAATQFKNHALKPVIVKMDLGSAGTFNDTYLDSLDDGRVLGFQGTYEGLPLVGFKLKPGLTLESLSKEELRDIDQAKEDMASHIIGL